MSNITIYAGIGGLIAIFIVGWIFISRKCRKEGKIYGEQQIRNPRELEGQGTSGGSSGTEQRVTEEPRREPVSKRESTRDEESQGDGSGIKLPIESDNTNVNNEQPVESDSNSIEHTEQVDGSEPEEEIPEVDSL